MAAPVWQPGTLYLPGDLVQPKTQPAATVTSLSNGGFETGDATDWTLPAGASVVAGGYTGSWSLRFTGTAGEVEALHDPVPVTPGISITAGCMYGQGAASTGRNAGRVLLRFLDNADVQVGEVALGNLITSSSGGGWKASRVLATAPEGATQVQIGCRVIRNDSETSGADLFAWDYAQQALPAGLIYKAVQAAPGHSDEAEPDWPTTLGVTVVDHEVIWEAVATSRVTWTASPILTSGATEPDWPTEPGERVVDHTIAWECVTRRVEDENCPNTTVVAIIAAKVLAADGDIVRHSAAVNPLDWTTARNAGFLATGLQQANASDFAVLAPYRNNLAAFNAHCFQHWQMDPDPELCAQLDQLDGVGSTWKYAAVAVSNELFYLTPVGVRSIGIAVGAQNLAAGDVGEPVDDLVQAQLAVDGVEPRGTYYPGMGQYWLAFPTEPVETCAALDLANVHFFAGYADTVNPALGEVDGSTVTILSAAETSQSAVIHSPLAIDGAGVPVDLTFTVAGNPDYLYLFLRAAAGFVPGLDWPGATSGADPLALNLVLGTKPQTSFDEETLFTLAGTQCNLVDADNNYVSTPDWDLTLSPISGTPYDDATLWRYAWGFEADAEEIGDTWTLTVTVGGQTALVARLFGESALPADVFSDHALLFGFDHVSAANSVTFATQCYAVDPDDTGSSEVLVYTMRQAGRRGDWSRYVFPFAVAGFAQLGNRLYIRHGDEINVVTEGLLTDAVGGVAVPFAGRVQWNWLDLGAAGQSAFLEGFDVEGAGAPSISFGYDQRSTSAFTTPWAFDPDTLGGGLVPFPLQAPSLSVRLDFAAGTAWSLKRVILYTLPSGTGPG